MGYQRSMDEIPEVSQVTDPQSFMSGGTQETEVTGNTAGSTATGGPSTREEDDARDEFPRSQAILSDHRHLSHEIGEQIEDTLNFAHN